jgi:hypothetical protein
MRSTVSGRTSRAVALLLLLVSVWTSSHRQQDDDACLPVVAGEHDESKHVYTAPAAIAHEHCAVCHWARGLQPPSTGATAATTVLTTSDGLSASAEFTHAAPVSGRLPARAPPTQL